LRTPAIRELIKVNLQADPQQTRQVAEALLRGDTELTLSLAHNIPDRINALTQVLAELTNLLESLPPPLRGALSAQLAEKVDGQALAQELSRLCKLARAHLREDAEARARMMQVLVQVAHALLRESAGAHQQDGRALAEPLAALFLDLLGAGLDFGLVRQGAVSLADSTDQVMPEVLRRVVGDPVILANLVEVLPPLLNTLVGLSGEAIKGVAMPAEVLASTLFNLIQKVDTARLGRLVNGLCVTIQQIHEGSAVLGRHEPRFRAVYTRFVEQLLSEVDREDVARAAMVLAEDAETVLLALGDILLRDPDILPLALGATRQSLGSVMRGAAGAMERLTQLPPQQVEKIARELSAEDTARDAASLINAATKLALEVLRVKPDIAAASLESFWCELDRARVGRVAESLFIPLLKLSAEKLARDPDLRRALAAPLMESVREMLWQSFRELPHKVRATILARLSSRGG